MSDKIHISTVIGRIRYKEWTQLYPTKTTIFWAMLFELKRHYPKSYGKNLPTYIKAARIASGLDWVEWISLVPKDFPSTIDDLVPLSSTSSNNNEPFMASAPRNGYGL